MPNDDFKAVEIILCFNASVSVAASTVWNGSNGPYLSRLDPDRLSQFSGYTENLSF